MGKEEVIFYFLFFIFYFLFSIFYLLFVICGIGFQGRFKYQIENTK